MRHQRAAARPPVFLAYHKRARLPTRRLDAGDVADRIGTSDGISEKRRGSRQRQYDYSFTHGEKGICGIDGYRYNAVELSIGKHSQQRGYAGAIAMTKARLTKLLRSKALKVAKRSIRNGECIYSLRMVRPVRVDLLAVACDELRNAVRWGRGAIHIVAIAQSGVPLATTIALALSQRAHRVFLSVVDPRRPHAFVADGLPNALLQATLVDNSIKTGRTARRAISQLRRYGIQCSRLLVLQSELDPSIGRVEGVPIVSAFSQRDLAAQGSKR